MRCAPVWVLRRLKLTAVPVSKNITFGESGTQLPCQTLNTKTLNPKSGTQFPRLWSVQFRNLLSNLGLVNFRNLRKEQRRSVWSGALDVAKSMRYSLVRVRNPSNCLLWCQTEWSVHRRVLLSSDHDYVQCVCTWVQYMVLEVVVLRHPPWT